MKKELKDRMDIVDALEDVKSQLCFMNHACTGILGNQEKDGLPGDAIITGMNVIFETISERVGEVSEAVQKNFNRSGDANISDSELRRLADVPAAFRFMARKRHTKKATPVIQ